MGAPSSISSRLSSLARDEPWRAAALALSVSALATAIGVVLRPWFDKLHTFGFHDWDVQTAHRYLVRLSLLGHGEMPWWNPFACGGFPAWGYIEADTILVSPYLPLYLALPMSIALRLEVLGQAVIGAAGAYAAGSRFTRSHAARALVAALWAVNGRWALQAAAGHTWHLAYAWLPWCFFFFERARAARPARVVDLAGAAFGFALLVYSGGIYPLPHTVLALGLYAAALAVLERSPRPLLVLLGTGLLGVGLAAPKLLPMLDGFKKVPRLIDSNETMDLGALVAMLTSPDQAFYSRPARVSPYGWHEWGIYVGSAGAFALLAGFVLVSGRREVALKIVAVILVALGFGAFHPSAPWTLLHKHAPFFQSQHVPSRFLYPAVLVLGLVVASGVGRMIDRRSIRAPWLDAAAALIVTVLALDVARVAAKPMADAMWMDPPPIPAGRTFHFEKEPPFQYKRRDWAGPMYLAMLGNTGVLNCYGAPPFDRKGARAVDDPRYRGEAWIADGSGHAEVIAWSPNGATVDVSGAEPGAVLVYNMNYDEGWSSDAGRVVSHDNAVAVRLPAGTTRVRFSYRPPLLGLGLAVGFATALGLWALWRRERTRVRGGAA